MFSNLIHILDIFWNCSSGTYKLLPVLMVLAMMSATLSLFSKSPPDWKKNTVFYVDDIIIGQATVDSGQRNSKTAQCFIRLFLRYYSPRSQPRPLSVSDNPFAPESFPFFLAAQNRFDLPKALNPLTIVKC